MLDKSRLLAMLRQSAPDLLLSIQRDPYQRGFPNIMKALDRGYDPGLMEEYGHQHLGQNQIFSNPGAVDGAMFSALNPLSASREFMSPQFMDALDPASIQNIDFDSPITQAIMDAHASKRPALGSAIAMLLNNPNIGR
jgi:hypothetical protein